MPKTKSKGSKAPAKPMSKTGAKAKTARKQIAGKKPVRKAVAAHGVEPITEGPYANAGPEYEKRVAAGNAPVEGPVRLPAPVVTA
jgi:hypothetical protein